jgi:hypothetical protein
MLAPRFSGGSASGLSATVAWRRAVAGDEYSLRLIPLGNHTNLCFLPPIRQLQLPNSVSHCSRSRNSLWADNNRSCWNLMTCCSVPLAAAGAQFDLNDEQRKRLAVRAA